MTTWKTYKISDIGRIVTGKTPKTSIQENYGGDIPFLTPSDDLSGKYSPKTSKTLTQVGLSEVKNCLLPANSICVSCIGSDLGKVVKVTQPTVTNQQFNSIIPNCDFDADFVYYLMTIVGKQLNYLSKTSTAVPIINKTQFSNFEVRVPSLEEQRRIAGILSAIDDKIENNRRINTNLELQAQALYKQWFVDNHSDDWEMKSLSDLMGYQGGSQPPASEFIDKPQDGYVRFVQIRDYASNTHPTYIPIAKKNKLCNKKDIMIARYGASLGRICFGLDGAYNVALAKVKPLENHYKEFLRCYLSSNEFYNGINMKGNRAVQAGFNQSDINSFTISCPKEDVFVAFENIASKIFDKRLLLQQENETLVTLRDTLLPKLMNGEIKL